MADVKEKILQTAKDNLKTLGDALGKELSGAIEADRMANATELYLQLANVKDSFIKIYGDLDLDDIPDEIYTEMTRSLIESMDEIVMADYSGNREELLEKIADQIGNLFTKIDDIELNIDGVDYEVAFKGSRLGLKGYFIRVSNDDDEVWINWKSSSYGQSVMARYAISLFQLDKILNDSVAADVSNIFSTDGNELLTVLFDENAAENLLKKVLGTSLFNAIGAENVKSKLKEFLYSVTEDTLSDLLEEYEDLVSAYKDLVEDINSVDTNELVDKFTNAANEVQSSLKSLGNSVMLEILPTVADGLTYNLLGTAVTVSADYGDELTPSDYKSTVKIIDASNRTKAIKITGNSKANSIVGGTKADTLDGGKGNDTLTGGAGNDIFIYTAGKDVITDYATGDKISLSAASKKESVKGSDVIITFDSGSLTIKDAAGKSLNWIDENGNSHTTVISGASDDDDKNSATVTLTNSDESTFTAGDKVKVIDASARTKAVKIIGNSKANTITGGSKNDTLTGGAGKDIFVYTAGKDTITDYASGDKISISSAIKKSAVKGSDVVLTIGKGSLTIKDAAGEKLAIIDENGKNYTTIIGGASNSATVTLTNSDSATFTAGDKVKIIDSADRTKAVEIIGNSKANSIVGGSKNDKLYGLAGNDKIYGGKGNDTIYGGKGNDSLWGDAGKDTFIYNNGDGKDVIYGFENNDLLKITGDFSASYDGSKNEIAFKVGSGSITLKEFTATTFNVNGDKYKISGGNFVKK